MDTNAMKRMIVLKNLQSNMVEEAYIVFKDNVKVHRAKKIEDEKTDGKLLDGKDKEYMIKEAELIVNEYISKLEGRNYKVNDIDLKQNYKRLKIISISLCIFSVLDFILLILK